MKKNTILTAQWLVALAVIFGVVAAVICAPQVTFGAAGCQHAGVRFNTESKYVGPPYYKHCYLTNGERWMSTGEYARLYGKVGGER